MFLVDVKAEERGDAVYLGRTGVGGSIARKPANTVAKYICVSIFWAIFVAVCVMWLGGCGLLLEMNKFTSEWNKKIARVSITERIPEISGTLKC